MKVLNLELLMIMLVKRKRVHSDIDASELDILGQFGRLLDKFGAFRLLSTPMRPFSPIIGSLKKTRDGRMDGQTDSIIEMRGRI